MQISVYLSNHITDGIRISTFNESIKTTSSCSNTHLMKVLIMLRLRIQNHCIFCLTLLHP